MKIEEAEVLNLSDILKNFYKKLEAHTKKRFSYVKNTCIEP